jgi:hypothetical protein
VAASAALAVALVGLVLPATVRADETLAEREARLAKMQPEEKEALQSKKRRFDSLDANALKHVTELHAAIANEPNGKQLDETIRRYNKWLANLSFPQRAAILKITDSTERIAKIKQLIEQQERERFSQFVQEEIGKEDQDAIYAWAEDFVLANEAKILGKLPEVVRRRIEGMADETRRRSLIGSWNYHVFRNRELALPAPNSEELNQLVGKLSPKTRTQLSAVASPEQREQRVMELIRAVILSRVYQAPSREELRKFYAAMKPEDPRRESLENLQQDALYRELHRMFDRERFGRGGPGQRGGPGDGMRGRGGRGEGPPPPPGESRGQRPPPPKGDERGP